MPSGFDPAGSANRWSLRVVWGVAGRVLQGMKNRLNSGLIGSARRILMIGAPAVGLALAMVGAAPVQQASAQEINIGASIAATVAEAVSGIATSDESGSAFGGLLLESNEIELGDDESTAIADSSGGSHNVSSDSGSGHGE